MNLNVFFEETKKFKFPENLKKGIQEIIENENKLQGEISIIICSDNYLLKINNNYLKHDYYTDVITFDYSEKKIISGDIFISAERVKENATIYQKPFLNELMRVLIHGILHLAGYKDKTNKEIGQMRAKEEFYLNQFFKPN
jgi:probable rRNA maturation factor